MSPLPELIVEVYVPSHHRPCEFEPGECDGTIAYTVTPTLFPGVHRDDEYTTFVCREHLGELIALRLAGKYPAESSTERHEGCQHSREHDADCEDEADHVSRS